MKDVFNRRSQTGYFGHGFESMAHGAFLDSGGGQHLIEVALDGLSKVDRDGRGETTLTTLTTLEPWSRHL